MGLDLEVQGPPPAPRPRPSCPGPAPGLRKAGTLSHLFCRWGFLSSRQHNGRGSSRHLFRTRKRSSERVSNLPKDTQLQSIRSPRAGGRSWKAVPGKGEEGLCIPARLQGLGSLEQQKFLLSQFWGPVIREPGVGSLLVDCRQLLVPPGLWTHHPVCLTTWPLPVCLCSHIVLPGG